MKKLAILLSSLFLFGLALKGQPQECIFTIDELKAFAQKELFFTILECANCQETLIGEHTDSKYYVFRKEYNAPNDLGQFVKLEIDANNIGVFVKTTDRNLFNKYRNSFTAAGYKIIESAPSVEKYEKGEWAAWFMTKVNVREEVNYVIYISK